MNAEPPRPISKPKVDSLWAEMQAESSVKAPSRPAALGGLASGNAVVRPAEKAAADVHFPTTSVTKAPQVIPGRNAYIVSEERDFAGEMVTVTKEVEVGSAEDVKRQQSAKFQARKGTGTNLDDLVARVTGKRKTCTTLDKSASDWSHFTKEEGLTDELDQYRKNGYLQKVAFLNRTDDRQEQKLKEMRQTKRR
mmetsp:Transcript_2631/g.6899  ORF Transcript_2631/g.6899 Transcript_2631/m.6899 type:complete len:194 (-) Transcript_2631:53-634(-)